jgi:hypothetical protein
MDDCVHSIGGMMLTDINIDGGRQMTNTGFGRPSQEGSSKRKLGLYMKDRNNILNFVCC